MAIDWSRGAVMVLMALDHVRYFLTNVPFPPEDIEKTSLALFLTRWVTHFCAPAFFFLAGAGVALSAHRRGKVEPMHLVARGLLLIVLELTIVGFSWEFTPGYSFAGVIWSLGWSMILLALCVRLPPAVLLTIAVVIIGGHDHLTSTFGSSSTVWRLLHVPGDLHIGHASWFVLYPLIPWCAVMIFGYATKPFWGVPGTARRRIFFWTGIASTAMFVLLRVTNGYGNPPGWGAGRDPFATYPSAAKTVISLLNVAKYPASLQYLLMTLGPLLIALAVLERFYERHAPGIASKPILVFGRVPLLFYILHLYVIHLAALLVHSHYGLGPIYATWLLILFALYWPCRAYDAFKRTHNAAWTRFV